jgi:hypothetical protein
MRGNVLLNGRLGPVALFVQAARACGSAHGTQAPSEVGMT